MINLLSEFSNIIASNIFLGIGLALLAGVISSFTPCVLTSIPLIVGYVGGYAKDDKKKAFLYSLTFVLGITMTFTTLGILSAILGKMMNVFGTWWYLLLGILMLLIGLQILGIVNIIPSRTSSVSKRKGAIGAFLLGLIAGVFGTPCSTPVLIAILLFVAERGDIFSGILLLLSYSIGHSILIVIAGSSVAITQKLATSSHTEKIGKALKIILGILVIVIALYLFYLGF